MANRRKKKDTFINKGGPNRVKRKEWNTNIITYKCQPNLDRHWGAAQLTIFLFFVKCKRALERVQSNMKHTNWMKEEKKRSHSKGLNTQFFGFGCIQKEKKTRNKSVSRGNLTFSLFFGFLVAYWPEFFSVGIARRRTGTNVSGSYSIITTERGTCFHGTKHS